MLPTTEALPTIVLYADFYRVNGRRLAVRFVWTNTVTYGAAHWFGFCVEHVLEEPVERHVVADILEVNFVNVAVGVALEVLISPPIRVPEPSVA